MIDLKDDPVLIIVQLLPLLPMHEQLVLSMYCEDNLSIQEIAKQLNMGVQKVAWLLGKASNAVYTCTNLTHINTLIRH